jgi:hypothetical protein
MNEDDLSRILLMLEHSVHRVITRVDEEKIELLAVQMVRNDLQKIIEFLKLLKAIKTRDFGLVTTEFEGLTLGAKAIVPGITIQNLVNIYEHAYTQGNDLAGNPGEWSTVRGINAVVDTVFEAINGQD